MNEKTKKMFLELGETLLDTAVTFLARYFLNGSKKQKRVLVDEERIDEQARAGKKKGGKSNGNRTRQD